MVDYYLLFIASRVIIIVFRKVSTLFFQNGSKPKPFFFPCCSCIQNFPDRQGLTACESGPASERAQRTDLGDHRARKLALRNRRDNRALRRRLLRRWTAHIQGLAVLRGQVGSNTRPDRDFEIPPLDNAQSRNGDSRWQDSERAHRRGGQRAQRRVCPFLAKCFEVFARTLVELLREIEKATRIRPENSHLRKLNMISLNLSSLVF